MRTSRAGCPEGRIASRGCQLRGTPLSRNVHFVSPQPYATGHVEIAERSSCRNSIPSSCFTRLEPVLFRVLLQRRLSLPRLLTKRICRCGRLLDAFGDHRAACSWSECWREGASRWKAQLLECAERQEERVPTNLFVRDMDLGVPNAHDTDVWKLWPTVCHCLVACSLLWTLLLVSAI